VFRRRRPTDQPDPSQVDDDLSTEQGDTELESEPDPEPAQDPVPGGAPRAGTGRPQGPWDSADVPDEVAVNRLDLGSLHVPVPEGLEVRVEVQDDVVVAATFVDGQSQLQVHAFAAPKSAGVWDDVRAEIADSLRESKGSADDVEGPFGPELRARVPEEPGLVPARFLGVDGPRWFLRGLVTGPAATNPEQARRLEGAFRDVVVHRGGEAMAPRDLLPLHLPREAMVAGPDGAPPRSLELPERGPEITETQ